MPRLAGRGGEEANMKYHRGKWYYQGKTYNSLHEALVANWSRFYAELRLLATR
jgi:hypothetical protein